jgi:hypothetical protein
MNEQQAPPANGSRGMKLSPAGRRLTRVLTAACSPHPAAGSLAAWAGTRC